MNVCINYRTSWLYLVRSAVDLVTLTCIKPKNNVVVVRFVRTTTSFASIVESSRGYISVVGSFWTVKRSNNIGNTGTKKFS